MLFFAWNKSIGMSFQQLLLYGVHIGHSFRNSWIYSGWLIFNYYQNLFFINLLKTWKSWQTSVFLIEGATYNRQPIWFVNLDGSCDHIIKYSAKNCGEYSCSSNWINGLASNYSSFLNIFQKYIQGHRSWSANKAIFKKAIKNFHSDNWGLNRHSYPRLFFVSNVHSSYKATKEAFYANTAAMGIVDTNTYSQLVSLPIPANDDSLDCIVFYNEFVSYYILYRKFFVVLSWYYNVRKFKRFDSFNVWLKNRLKNNKKISWKNNKKNLFSEKNISNILVYGINFFVSRNILLTGSKEDVNIYYRNKVTNKLDYMNTLIEDRLNYNKYKVLFSIAANSYKFIQGKFLKRNHLKREHLYNVLLKKEFFDRKLLRNRFYRFHFIAKRKMKTSFAKWHVKYFLFERFFEVLDTSRARVSKFLFNSFYFRFIGLHVGIFLHQPIKKFDIKTYYKYKHNYANLDYYRSLSKKDKSKKDLFHLWELKKNIFSYKLKKFKTKKPLYNYFNTNSSPIKDVSNIRNFTQYRLFNIFNYDLGNTDNLFSNKALSLNHNYISKNVEFFFKSKFERFDHFLWNRRMRKEENKTYFKKTLYYNNYHNYHKQSKDKMNEYIKNTERSIFNHADNMYVSDNKENLNLEQIYIKNRVDQMLEERIDEIIEHFIDIILKKNNLRYSFKTFDRNYLFKNPYLYQNFIVSYIKVKKNYKNKLYFYTEKKIDSIYKKRNLDNIIESRLESLLKKNKIGELLKIHQNRVSVIKKKKKMLLNIKQKQPELNNFKLDYMFLNKYNKKPVIDIFNSKNNTKLINNLKKKKIDYIIKTCIRYFFFKRNLNENIKYKVSKLFYDIDMENIVKKKINSYVKR